MSATATNPYYPYNEIEIPGNLPYVTFNDECPYDFKLSQEEPCGTYEVAPIYMQVEWLPVAYDVVEEAVEDGYGIEKIVSRAVNRLFAFECYADEYMLKFIYELIYSSERLLLEDPTAVQLEIYNANAEHEELTRGSYRVTVSFYSDDVAAVRFGHTACCRPLYEEAPYDPECPSDGGEGPINPECDDLAIHVIRNDDSLVANVSGAPGTYSVTWLYRATPSGTWQTLIVGATSISLAGFGTYRAVVTAAGCGQLHDQYLYQDPCGGYDVRIRRSGRAGLVAEMPQGYEGASFVWEFNDGTGWVTLDDTTAAIVADESGDYRVTATYEECEDQDVTSIVVTSCDFSAVMNRAGNTLSIAVSGCSGTPSFTWALDRGDGPVALPGTTETHEATQSGLYITDITCDGCVLTIQRVVLIDECNVCELTTQITVEGPYAILNHSGCDDIESATIQWSRNSGQGWTLIGSGTQLMEMTQTGLYRARMQCGDCVSEAFYLHMVCDECDEFTVTITEEGGVFTASADCEEAIYQWEREDQNGIEILDETGDSITPTAPGLYRARVTCGACTSTAAFIAYDCDGCLEVFNPGSPNPIIVCG